MKCCNCDSNEATADRADHDGLPLCERCRLRFDLQQMYEQRLLLVAERLESKDYAGAMAAIDATESELGHLDVDGWLMRSVMADRGMVFRKQERWEEALATFESRLQLPFEDPGERASTCLDAALILIRSGRIDDARVYVNSAWDCLEHSHPQAALPNLLRWLETGDNSVFVGRDKLIAAALRAYNLSPPAEVSSNPIAALNWAKRTWRS